MAFECCWKNCSRNGPLAVAEFKFDWNCFPLIQFESNRKKFHFSLVRFCGIHLRATSQWVPELLPTWGGGGGGGGRGAIDIKMGRGLMGGGGKMRKFWWGTGKKIGEKWGGDRDKKKMGGVGGLNPRGRGSGPPCPPHDRGSGPPCSPPWLQLA